jgi:energy-coupling factor transporter ATP-binding protein EcfA2
VTVAINPRGDLSPDLERLARSLDNLVFREMPGKPGPGATRDRLVRAIRSYLIPRIEGPAPLLVVFAGSTGAGKSTLLNSLSGIDVSETGALRPTTREPVVLSADPAQYRSIAGVECRSVSGSAPILESMAFVDTPDIDSTSSRHRAVAEIMIDQADIVVFVSSASRYGDLVPWEVMRRARSRGAPLLVVLNRVTSTSGAALTDFQMLLEREGLGTELVVVHEHHLGPGSSSVPSVAVRSLRRRLLSEVARHREQRSEIMKTVLWSTLGEARDLIAQADLAALETELVSQLVEARVSPDLDRLIDALPDLVEHRIDLARITDLGRLSPRRARRRLRRLEPLPEQIAATRRWLHGSLAAAVRADLRESLGEGLGVAGGAGDRRYLASANQVVVPSIESWSAALQATAGAERPNLVALLAEMAVLEVPDARSALDVLIGADGAEPVTRATAGLLEALRPAYDEVRDHVASAMAVEVSGLPALDDARVALSEVAALSAFANA